MLVPLVVSAQIVPVGSGSYTATFPAGTLSTGHVNWQPQTNLPWSSLIHEDAHPLITSNMNGRPIPTNDWWSSLVWPNQIGGNQYLHSLPMWAYPVTYQAKAEGMGMARPVTPPVNGRFHMAGYGVDMVVTGIDGMNAPDARLHDFSDWTVTADFNDGTNHMRTTIGHGMPYSYYEKISGGNVYVDFGSGVEIPHSAGPECIIFFTQGRKWAVFAPEGSTWVKSGARYTSNLNGKNYWSIVLLPDTGEAPEVFNATLFEEYRKRAYAFPTSTVVDWTYNEGSATLTTNYTVSTSLKENVNGNVNNTILALLPHQWSRATGLSYWANSYACMRGEMKVYDGNSFTVSEQFNGVLPMLPDLGQFSAGYSAADLSQMLEEAIWDNLQITESYNQGKQFFKFIQIVHLAEQLGNTAIRDNALGQIQAALEEWLTATPGELDEVFYYNDEWGVMLGYPDGHYASSLLNDHHFHWAYFIHAAAVLEQYQPGWAVQWGGMVDLLIRDAASPDRNDAMFPYLRNFDPYAGHSWANGGARDFVGNDQESSSESMQFNTTMILWGQLTGNTQLRDMGIYLYLTEKSAIEEYWWDVHDRNFDPNFSYSAMGRIFGGGNQLATVWTIDIPEAYGINYLPIHGGSLYLGHYPNYVTQAYNEMLGAHGANEPDLWNDIFWMYLSFGDAPGALARFNAYPDYPVEYAETKAHTYHWLHNMNAMGQVETGVTADYPISAVFNKAGVKTYVAYNYGTTPVTVTFSDGYVLNVPAGEMATSKDSPIQVEITSPAYGTTIASGNNVMLQATAGGATIDKVAFYRGSTLVSEDFSAPYTATDAGLADGEYFYTAVAHSGADSNTSNPVQVTVGQGAAQTPYQGNVQAIPGVVQIAFFDEGGEGVAYHDADGRNGQAQGIRPNERVDLESVTEGNTVGWVDPTEWLEYTVNVQQAGLYTVGVRVATPNTTAGPITLSFDGNDATSPVTVNGTSDWGTFQTQEIENVPIQAGTQILRFHVGNGGFNIGNLTFTRTGDLPGGGTDTEAPTVPGNLVVTAKTSSSLGLSWSASTDNVGVTGYDVYNGAAYIATVNGTSYTVTGLVASSPYTLRVRSKDAANNLSAFAEVTDTTNPVNTNPPSAGDILEDFEANRKMTFDLATGTFNQAAANPGANSVNSSSVVGDYVRNTGELYDVLFYRGVDLGDLGGLLAGTLTFEMDVYTAAPVGTTISIQLETPSAMATNFPTGRHSLYQGVTTVQGAWETISFSFINRPDAGAADASVNTMVLLFNPNSNTGDQFYFDNLRVAGGAPADTEAPTDPVITGTTSGTNSITLNWNASTDNVGVTGYRLYMDGNQVAEVNAQSYVFSGLQPDTGYSLGVQALDAAGNVSSITSQAAQTDPVPADTEAPTVPGGLTASNVTQTGLDLNWAASTDNVGVTGYEVYNGSTLLVAQAGTSYSVNGLTADQSYTFRVRATDATGNFSSYAETTVSTLPDAPPAGGTCTGDGIDGTGNGIDYTWEVSGGANPTITFKPSRAGIGQNIVIFYYQVGGSGGFPGFTLNADADGNYPYQITGAAGENVEFYFTYSVPEGGERNSADSKHNITIGNCSSTPPPVPNQAPTVSITSPAAGDTFTSAGTQVITADASDADGTVSQVEFYVDGTSAGIDATAPYTINWPLPGNGTYSLTAIATDNEGASTISTAVSVTVNIPAPTTGDFACTGEGWDYTTQGVQDFSYTVAKGESPAITFTPARAGIGTTTMLIVVNGAGFSMTPNGDGSFSYQTSGLAVGSSFTFYFVYSVPEGGERNSSANTYNCTVTAGTRVITSVPVAVNQFRMRMFPNPASSYLYILAEGSREEVTVRMVNAMGQEVKTAQFTGEQHQLDISALAKGIYIVRVQAGDAFIQQRIIKR